MRARTWPFQSSIVNTDAPNELPFVQSGDATNGTQILVNLYLKMTIVKRASLALMVFDYERHTTQSCSPYRCGNNVMTARPDGASDSNSLAKVNRLPVDKSIVAYTVTLGGMKWEPRPYVR